jgi:hypothetical protein
MCRVLTHGHVQYVALKCPPPLSFFLCRRAGRHVGTCEHDEAARSGPGPACARLCLRQCLPPVPPRVLGCSNSKPKQPLCHASRMCARAHWTGDWSPSPPAASSQGASQPEANEQRTPARGWPGRTRNPRSLARRAVQIVWRRSRCANAVPCRFLFQLG